MQSFKDYIRSLITEAKKPKVEGVAKEKTAGQQWHDQHPVAHMNIVNHYDQATKAEHHHGRNWYRDAHEYASSVAKTTNLPHHTIAGLVSTYSPQRDWHNNMIDASRVARRKKGIGGKVQKPYYKYGKSFAGDLQKKAAERLLKGEHYTKVIKGQKTHAFAHLIDHGGDADPKNPQVVVDRHAHSVASGARITDGAFDAAGLKTKKKYGAVKKAYIDAADHINKRNNAKHGDAHYLHPHQLQATTWLVRQRLNNDDDVKSGKKGPKDIVKAAKSRENAKQKWKTYSQTWHPGASHLFVKEENEE